MTHKFDAKIVIAGGGTGGHVYPAISIADSLNNLDVPKENIIFFGSNNSIENSLVPESGYKLFTFNGKGLNRGEYLKNVVNIFNLVVSCFKCFFLLIRIKPKVVIGVGGFASLPAIASASILRIPRFVHEQNSYMGRTNKLAETLGAKIISSFPNIKNAKHESEYLGLPLRVNVELAVNQRKDFIKKSSVVKSITITGGSLGSKVINETVLKMCKKYRNEIDFQIQHICGKLHYEDLSKSYSDSDLEKIVSLHSYRDDLSTLFARSNAVVARAGAGTCVELMTIGVPCVLIPLPSAPGDHQRLNAQELVESGIAEILDQKDLTEDTLFLSIKNALEKVPSEPANTFHLQASNRIATYILSNIGG